MINVNHKFVASKQTYFGIIMRKHCCYDVVIFLLVFKFATSNDESWHPNRQLLKINYNPEGEILVDSFWQK